MAEGKATVLRTAEDSPRIADIPAPPRLVARPRIGRRRLTRWGLLVLGPLAVILVTGWYYVTGGRYISTDDAYVKTDVAAVNAQVSGRVLALDVRDNQPVTAGQLLLTIDPGSYNLLLPTTPRSYSLAYTAAAANLAQVADQIAALRANYVGKEAALHQTQETITFLTREFQRQSNLAGHGYASEQAYDTAHHNLVQAQAQADIIRQQMAAIQAELGGNIATPTKDLPQYQAALALRDDADQALKLTKVYAPAAGIVTNVTLRPGDYINAGAPLFSLAEIRHTWVTGNFKETELTYVKQGQPATVTVDAYPGVVWHAKVESLSPASGDVFSLLPPQNATGNWVKVVQRIPVRLEVENKAGMPQLRAGMSVTAEIDTHHHRYLPAFLAKIAGLFGLQ